MVPGRRGSYSLAPIVKGSDLEARGSPLWLADHSTASSHPPVHQDICSPTREETRSRWGGLQLCQPLGAPPPRHTPLRVLQK